MIEILCREVPAKQYIITEIEDGRKVSARELAEVFSRYTNREVCICPDVKKAFLTAAAKKGNGKLFCVGSLYLIGEIRRMIKEKEVEMN